MVASQRPRTAVRFQFRGTDCLVTTFAPHLQMHGAGGGGRSIFGTFVHHCLDQAGITPSKCLFKILELLILRIDKTSIRVQVIVNQALRDSGSPFRINYSTFQISIDSMESSLGIGVFSPQQDFIHSRQVLTIK